MPEMDKPTPKAAADEPKASEKAEPRIPLERFLDLAPRFERELGRRVTRGAVAGAQHKLALERGSHMPKTLPWSEMATAIVAYLDSEA